MNALHLDIEKHVGRHLDAAVLGHVVGEQHLALVLDVHKGALKSSVVGKLAKVAELGEVAKPRLAAKLLRDEIAQLGVRHEQPAS